MEGGGVALEVGVVELICLFWGQRGQQDEQLVDHFVDLLLGVLRQLEHSEHIHKEPITHNGQKEYLVFLVELQEPRL